MPYVTTPRCLRPPTRTHWRSLLLAAGVTIVSTVAACGNDDPQEKGSRGGVIGFATGTQASGPVPSGGTMAQAPVIAGFALARSEIAIGDPLVLSIEFSDSEADVAEVHFGIVGESPHYTLETGMAAGQSSGTILLELHPSNPQSGHYLLQISLADAAGNVSHRHDVAFVILTADGFVPNVGSGGTASSGGSSGIGGTGTQPGTGGAGDVPEFLMVQQASSGDAGAVVRVACTPTGERITPVIDLIPRAKNTEAVDLRNGRVAMLLDDTVASRVPEGRGPIVVFDLDRPDQRWFVPIPAREGEDSFTVDRMRPQLLPDGRVVYAVTLETANPYDDHHERQLAIWDPLSDALTLQGELSGFVLQQPEVAQCNCDAEDGSLGADTFTVSQDGRHVYFTAYAYGTEAGGYHRGPYVLGRYEVASGQNERMSYGTEAFSPWAVSGDGGRVVVRLGSSMHLLDTSGRSLAEYHAVAHSVVTGQMSDGDVFVKGWRGCDPGAFGGVMRFDARGSAPWKIIDGEQLPSGFRGLDNLVQLTKDAKTVYFVASADSCTNYAKPLTLYRAPVSENASHLAEKLLELPAEYGHRLFVLIQ